eukprot:3803485-Prymnesium_polylepis.1
MAAILGHPAVCTRVLAAHADVRARTRLPLILEPIHWAAVQGRGCGAADGRVVSPRARRRRGRRQHRRGCAWPRRLSSCQTFDAAPPLRN